MNSQRQNNQQQNKRKGRQGDWICIQCFNYNYAFRQYCNRCHFQQKNQNERLLSAIGKKNYGENSFPSVLFLQYPNKDEKQNPIQPSKIIHKNDKKKYKKGNFMELNSKDDNDEADSILAQNIWISNLIDE